MDIDIERIKKDFILIKDYSDMYIYQKVINNNLFYEIKIDKDTNKYTFLKYKRINPEDDFKEYKTNELIFIKHV